MSTNESQPPARRPGPSPSCSRTSRARRACSRRSATGTAGGAGRSPSAHPRGVRRAMAPWSADRPATGCTSSSRGAGEPSRRPSTPSSRIAGHDWPDGIVVRDRMGLHTGEPRTASEGYVGLDVHRAARICAAGHGGQILISQTTRDLVADELRPPTGRHRPGRPPAALARRPAAAALPGHRARSRPRIPAAAHDGRAAQQPQARGHELHRTRARDRAGDRHPRRRVAPDPDRARRRRQDARRPPAGPRPARPVRGWGLDRRVRGADRPGFVLPSVVSAIGLTEPAGRSPPRRHRRPPEGQAPAARPRRLRSGPRRVRRARRGARPVLLDRPHRRHEPGGARRAGRGDPAHRLARHAGGRLDRPGAATSTTSTPAGCSSSGLGRPAGVRR